MKCPPLAQLAAYFLDELPAEEAASIEEHYFECDACAHRAEGMRSLCAQVAGMLPHVLTAERRRALDRAGQPLVVTRVGPGHRAELTFGRGIETGYWVLEAPLANAERVDLELFTNEDVPLFRLADVPFDRARGEVVLACQSSYRTLTASPELHARLTAVDRGGRSSSADYVLDHVFDSS